jgi:GxxExxY protein
MAVDHDNRLTGRVIGAAIAVHRDLGPGLAETVYQKMLRAELEAAGVEHDYEVPLPVRYKCVRLDCGYRMDLLIEARLIVELKAVEVLLPVHEAQLLTYLRLAPRELGLLINFDVPVLVQGLRRRILTAEAAPPASETMNAEAAARFGRLSGEVLAAAVEVHRALGPGLLQSAYEECLCHELSLRGLSFERAKTFAARHLGVEIADALEIPLLVSNELPVLCVSVRELTPLHQARLLARLRQGCWPSGLLLNFNVTSLPKGIRRVVNTRQ